MDIYEIISKGQNAGFVTGLDNSGVNFLDPADAFEVLRNGFIYRQELKSRKGFMQFGNRLGNQKTDFPDGTRVMGIFENIDPAGDGTRELLVITTKYLYSYNSVTEIFTQIHFSPRLLTLDPTGEFAIASRDEYVSGTTYFAANGTKRFVFTGKGMKAVYFYDGTHVKGFTDNAAIIGDNTDYKPYNALALTKATKVHWFNGKINFFVPVLGGSSYHQSVLYSGTRDTTGKGDQFNVVGSGLETVSTYELMKGTHFLGDVIIMEFQKSVWTLTKTSDSNIPYITRKIPSVIGTDATFSLVGWSNEVKSLGSTGLITTDGRKSVRFDNKIPNFTTDEIEQPYIDLTYGGFDRNTGHFMFAYRQSESPLADETQDQVLIYNYEESTWAIYDQRFSVFGETYSGKNLAWNQIDETVEADWARWDTTDEIWNKIGLGEATQKTLAGDDDGYVYRLNVDFDDYAAPITAINQAASAVIAAEAGFKIGDEVYIRNVVGMTEINEKIATVSAATGAAVTVNLNSTDYTAYTSGGFITKIINFEAILAPFNPYRDQGMNCFVSHIEVLINNKAGSVYLDFSEDEEDTPFKKDVQLSPDPDSSKKRQWITAIVDQESNFLNIRIYKKNALQPIIISSIRIHCSPGSITSN